MTTDMEKELINEQETAQTVKEDPQVQDTAAEEAVEEAVQPEEESVKLEKEKAELSDRLMRVMAEYDNYRKRTQREKDSAYGDAQAMLITELLPVIDNFERALDNECTDEGFKKGVEMIYSSIMQLLKKHGAESFGAIGDTFDPNVHHAVMHIEDESLEENSVAEVFQKGYKMGDRTLRCAMVKTAN